MVTISSSIRANPQWGEWMPHGPGGGPIPVTPSGAIPDWGFPALEAGREDRRVSTLFVIPIDAPGLRGAQSGPLGAILELTAAPSDHYASFSYKYHPFLTLLSVLEPE
ncbi:hypothetical protein AnigIFM49718_005774 [Aspergillus niger]|nr:hypothetical protein AnigIFM49718_005774 [Aspergillus niger]